MSVQYWSRFAMPIVEILTNKCEIHEAEVASEDFLMMR
jgi:hypothetical protein